MRIRADIGFGPLIAYVIQVLCVFIDLLFNLAAQLDIVAEFELEGFERTGIVPVRAKIQKVNTPFQTCLGYLTVDAHVPGTVIVVHDYRMACIEFIARRIVPCMTCKLFEACLAKKGGEVASVHTKYKRLS